MMLSAARTEAALPFSSLSEHVETLLRDASVTVPPRTVHSLANGGSLFVMPASDATVAMTKLITFIPDNATRALPAIQGDVVVFDAVSGQRRLVLDGPTVTGRRTAAVSLLAAQKLSPHLRGQPMLIVGAGVQGRAHLEAFSQAFGVHTFGIASRSTESVTKLIEHAHTLGLVARRVDDPNAEIAAYPLIATTTSAQEVCMTAHPTRGAFICAVGSFTPKMVEWSPEVVQEIAMYGRIVLDSRDAAHEAGDLLQAGLPNLDQYPALCDLTRLDASAPPTDTVFFKSCGWAGWDLAAARCALRSSAAL